MLVVKGFVVKSAVGASLQIVRHAILGTDRIENCWTADRSKAIRFASKKQALDAAALYPQAGCIVERAETR